MKQFRPGTLAVRAVNDYRRRDVFGFLGVRYYLDNLAACSDDWARRVATALLITRSRPAYFHAEHFKEHTQAAGIEHRSMFIPSPNECLAEAALLAECARHPNVFGNLECVYSYMLDQAASRSGAFLPYTTGLRMRQEGIAKACEAFPSGVVRYTDIKKFYPNVDAARALDAWRAHSRAAPLADPFRRLGEALIDGYASSGLQAMPAILTGPMFSHLLANLVFRDIDRDLSSCLAVGYFRYVDDIALVGNRHDVERALGIVRDKVASIGLHLHPDDSPKSLQVPCRAWLAGRHDFHDVSRGATWIRLIGNVKRYLLQHPHDRDLLHSAFSRDGFRIPVRDYSTVAREERFAHQILKWAYQTWFRRNAQKLSVPGIVELARTVRDRLECEYQRLFDGAVNLTGYERKRRVSKLRYCAARLVYLLPEDSLLELSKTAAALPELFFHAEVLQAVATRRIDRVLAMGTNAAQAAAQPLRAAGADALSTNTLFQKAKEQSLAVFLMNGVTVHRPAPEQVPESELIRFALYGTDPPMMKTEAPFLREVACLHGISGRPRHVDMFDRAFDEDEALTLDAVTQLQQSIT
jgi:hypothetical protein